MSQATAGFGLTCCYGGLAWLSRSGPGPDLVSFAGTVALAFAIYAWAYVCGSRPAATRAGSVMFWAVVFRVIGFWGDPLFEDDFYRYLWDGYRFAVDGTPYRESPEAYFRDDSVPPVFQAILGRINHPDIPTIYGPTFEYVFRFAHWIAPGQLWALKLLFIGADCLLVWLLIRLAGSRNALLYAWNPLVIKEIAFTAHPDGLLPLLLLGAWWLGSHGWRLGAGTLLALAVAGKASAWLMIPFLLLGTGGTGVAAFAASFSLLYLPLWLQGATDANGLQAFARIFEFNSALYGLANAWLPAVWAKMFLGGGLLIACAGYFLHYRRQAGPKELPRGDWLFGGLLMVSPVINPWYPIWLLPFASVYPSRTAWVASAAVLFAYVTGLNLDAVTLSPYGHPPWLRPLEFGLIGLAFLADLSAARRANKLSPSLSLPLPASTGTGADTKPSQKSDNSL